MLSLGRNPGQYVVIGEDIIVQVVSMDGMLRLAIDAPKDMTIVRSEVYEQDHPVPECIKRSNERSKTGNAKRQSSR